MVNLCMGDSRRLPRYMHFLKKSKRCYNSEQKEYYLGCLHAPFSLFVVLFIRLWLCILGLVSFVQLICCSIFHMQLSFLSIYFGTTYVNYILIFCRLGQT
jgi:hypothetical protein